ncbi:MAG TPA: hypothetical protein PKE47_11715, partial [Verrucomicrobiota bacterium]|nr:hypothetical protein [Verrucomicrobiota bacterium]
MNPNLSLGRFSLGMGDRFAQQARAQLRACELARAAGHAVTPVWNKSNREHLIIGSEPAAVRAAAEAAVRAAGWDAPWFVDADHIRRETVDRFLPASDFFPIDVGDFIGQPADAADVEAFLARHPELVGRIEIAGIARPFETTRAEVAATAGKFLLA